ncbi:MAG: Na+/H+-exchanging protein [Cytophagaceae bacterium]|jgi:Kef-type K+ transport system membrane component KefB|nr:Na+/H+-exchanging protein [Cytophagaceae bacterium]
MKTYKNLLFYVLTVGGFTLLILYFLSLGQLLEIHKSIETIVQTTSHWQQFINTYHHNLTHPLAILLLQIITIIVIARIFGFFCKKIKQPTVIGEIAAGIFLGPSVVGAYIPEFSAFLFPVQSLGNLQFLSQIGLIFFMFIIGMELDLRILKNKANDALVISHASIIFPFTLGIGLAYYIYLNFAPATINFLSFALFLGIAMSITAFPVLARIVQERGLSKTRVGTIVITCAAADDITAWCLLAVVIAIVKAGTVVSALYTIIMAVAYVWLMMKFVQPFLRKLGDKYSYKESLSKPIVAIFFVILLLSSFTTEVIGIHALFGAFLAGVIMPSNMNFRNIFIEKIEDVSLVLLLPLFFVFTGLRTQIGLLNDIYLWQICGLIVLVAVVGKFLGSALSARYVGQSWRDSLTIGALMNTRGLMELVVLNIGYDLGVLSPEVFAMMVIMALATTLMTGPALDLINKFLPEKKYPVTHLQDSSNQGERKYKMLVSFGNPKRSQNMVKLANCFVKKTIQHTSVTALHLTHSTELNQINAPEYEQDIFKPIEKEAKKLNIPLFTVFKATQDIDKEIVHTANDGNYDLVIIGIGQSIFEGTILGKILGVTSKIINPERLLDTLTGKEKLFENSIFGERVKLIIKSSKVPVGFFIDKDLEEVEKVIIPIFSISDSFLLVYAQKLIHNSDVHVTIVDATGTIKQNPEIKENIKSIERITHHNISIVEAHKLNKELFSGQHLMLISIDGWQKALEVEDTWLADTPSTLIVKA